MTFPVLRVNDTMMTAAPVARPAQFQPPSRTGFPVASRRKCQTPAMIIATETNTGAVTGPTRGTGMRNRTSQVCGEVGQSSKTFKNM
jgi:hypothetical protein